MNLHVECNLGRGIRRGLAMPFDEARPSRANDFNYPPEAIGIESGIDRRIRDRETSGTILAAGDAQDQGDGQG